MFVVVNRQRDIVGKSMNRSDVHLLDLPDEILLVLLKKLNNIDVLYALCNINNKRLRILAQEKIFSNIQSSPLIRAQSGNRKVALISGSLLKTNYM
jgi:hypothetical protein